MGSAAAASRVSPSAFSAPLLASDDDDDDDDDDAFAAREWHCPTMQPRHCRDESGPSDAALVLHRFADADHNSIALQPTFIAVVQKFLDAAACSVE